MTRDDIDSAIGSTKSRRVHGLSGSLEHARGNPRFLEEATALATQNARGDRLPAILDSARSLMPALLAATGPLDLLRIRSAHATSEVGVFTTISSLFFVPWAHGDCSRKLAALHHAAEALTKAHAAVHGATDDPATAAKQIAGPRPFAPLTALYEAVGIDIECRARERRDGVVDEAIDVGDSISERRMDEALRDYTAALTDWIRSILWS